MIYINLYLECLQQEDGASNNLNVVVVFYFIFIFVVARYTAFLKCTDLFVLSCNSWIAVLIVRAWWGLLFLYVCYFM